MRSELRIHVSMAWRSQKVRDVRDLAIKVIPGKVPLLSSFTLGMINSDGVSKPFHACDLTGVL